MPLFVKSAIHPNISAGLEKIFGVPVIEAYSSTESGRICGNPLPPRRRKHGTVGPPTLHSNVLIVDDDGSPMVNGERGKVIVRGANVFDRYDHSASAIESAFSGEWYRTGDVGFFDEDGYLTLVGRTKEMINRGGQKIAPVEVDEALLAHPEISDAAAFAVPHPTLGEVVGAAIVVTPNSHVTEQGLSGYLRNRLDPFKWPRAFVFVEQIPRGPSGKIRRQQVVQLFETLNPRPHRFLDHQGLLADGAASPTEAKLETLWKALLQSTSLSNDDFFIRCSGQINLLRQYLFHVELGLEAVFSDASTLRTMAAKIEGLEGKARTGRSPDLPLLTIDDRVPRHRGNSQSGKKKFNRKSRASEKEVFDLFALDKDTGLRRMRPGAGSGSVVANSHGYRSPDISLQKSAGTIRFAFLGDSLTFGSWSGGNETTWPFHAIETLRRAHGGFSCDYINAAIPGNGITQVGVRVSRIDFEVPTRRRRSCSGHGR